MSERERVSVWVSERESEWESECSEQVNQFVASLRTYQSMFNSHIFCQSMILITYYGIPRLMQIIWEAIALYPYTTILHIPFHLTSFHFIFIDRGTEDVRAQQWSGLHFSESLREVACFFMQGEGQRNRYNLVVGHGHVRTFFLLLWETLGNFENLFPALSFECYFLIILLFNFVCYCVLGIAVWVAWTDMTAL